MYEYRATVVRVLDGDTVELDIDYGRRIHQTDICRLYGVNAPEIRGETKLAGLKATERLKELTLGKRLLTHTHLDKNDKYGRLLVEIWDEENPLHCLNHILVKEGHAVPFMVGDKTHVPEKDFFSDHNFDDTSDSGL